MSISLIANSGIQFHRFELEIDPNADVLGNKSTMGFYEHLDEQNMRISLQYAYNLPDNGDIWVPKKLLKFKDYLDENENLKDNINSNVVKPHALKESDDFSGGASQKEDDKEYYFTVNDITDCMEIFASEADENTWLPIPYFKRNSNGKSVFGPVSWARMIIKKKSENKAKKQKYLIILAFDTKIDKESSIPVDNENIIHFTPQEEHTTENDNYFAISNNEDLNFNFCDSEYYCDWVSKYLKKVYTKYLIKDDNESRLDKFPHLEYLGYYLYMIKYLEKMKMFPEVVFYSEKVKPVDVDLVIDIGNSNTCGVLFESPVNGDASFKFKSVKKLKLIDLSNPEKDYEESFSMRLAFVEPKFGEIKKPDTNNSKYNNFRWPSLLRLGKEASRFINEYNLDIDKGKETATHHSSPKRYLWDNKKAKIQWEFVNFDGQDLNKAIEYEGITEQFTDSGDYAYLPEMKKDDKTLPLYSRKSLMTFTYIEILLHAISQINSHDFRMTHGALERPRKLKRITITCPTSIVQYEQFMLRECATEAVRALSKFYSNSFLALIDEDDEQKNELEVIPRPNELAKNTKEDRRDWIYDEATCGQFVFLYAEVSKRYLNKPEVFFNLYGKRRDDVDDTENKALTIGSIDIGGGTTDLMICAYQYEKGQSVAVLKPNPLYWESFNLAGDDLLKNIVQEIILEGTPKDMNERGCTGVIETSARDKNIMDIAKRMNNFFGTDSNNQGHMQRIYRKNFIVQVAIPIALRYLQHAIDNQPDLEITYDELFRENKPNSELINFFNKHFSPLKFEEIKWKLSTDKVNKIVETSFDTIIKQLSVILSAYGCDFVLLAGKPTTIPKIREMFIQYYPVSPERIITLNNYRVGRWYPFADDIGYFEDPKTIVSVGALIALMGGSLGKLDGFTLDTRLLRKNLIPSTDYIGFIDKNFQYIENNFITPDEKKSEIVVPTLPLLIGYKQLPNLKYRGRPVYKLDFNDEEIRKTVIENNSLLEDEKDIDNAVTNFKDNLTNRIPYTVVLRREETRVKDQLTERVKEVKNIIIDRIRDANKTERSKRYLNLSVMTLPDETGYWLDTGEFVLNIK